MSDLFELKIAEAVEKIRPPVHVKHQLDISYTFEKNTILLFEKRASYGNPSEIMENPFAKIKFVKSKDNWTIYWMKGNLKWAEYKSDVAKMEEVFKIIKTDADNCFFG